MRFERMILPALVCVGFALGLALAQRRTHPTTAELLHRAATSAVAASSDEIAPATSRSSRPFKVAEAGRVGAGVPHSQARVPRQDQEAQPESDSQRDVAGETAEAVAGEAGTSAEAAEAVPQGDSAGTEESVEEVAEPVPQPVEEPENTDQYKTDEELRPRSVDPAYHQEH
jgi:hypothetical protein